MVYFYVVMKFFDVVWNYFVVSLVVIDSWLSEVRFDIQFMGFGIVFDKTGFSLIF